MSDTPYKIFGYLPSGEAVHSVTIQNAGLSCSILTYGASVQSLFLEGYPFSLVLGSNHLPDYWGDFHYFGAIIGRYANRIANGRFQLDGQEYQLSQNHLNQHCLHGGAMGASARNWQIDNVKADKLSLSLHFDDGEMGFPGAMKVQVTYQIAEECALEIAIQATTDRATPCSFTTHGYFNLDGTQDIRNHVLQIHASEFTPCDEAGIPIGVRQIMPKSERDFQRPKRLELAPFDQNFCLSNRQKPLREVALLHSDLSGLSMRVETTESGLQVYNLAHLEQLKFAGLALEPQYWPDAPNQPKFPKAILYPQERYHHQTRYIFHKEISP